MKQAPLVVLGALTLGLAACGGGDDRLSKEDYQEQGNAICSKYERQIDAVPEPRDNPESVVAYVDKVVPLAEKQVAEMRDLKPPENDQDAHDEMLREAERVVTAARRLGTAAENKDQAAAQRALSDGESASENADAIAKDLGLDACVDED